MVQDSAHSVFTKLRSASFAIRLGSAASGACRWKILSTICTKQNLRVVVRTLYPLRCLPRRSATKAGVKRPRRPQGYGYRQRLEASASPAGRRLQAGDGPPSGRRRPSATRASRLQPSTRWVALFRWRLRFGLRVVCAGRTIEPAAFEQWFDVRVAAHEILKQPERVSRSAARE